MLATKFELGLFERPFVDVGGGRRRDRHATPQRDLATTIARKSLVLLKNDGALPLAPDARLDRRDRPERRRARATCFGDYSYPAHVESLLEMLESRRERLLDRTARTDLEFGRPTDARGAHGASMRCARASGDRVTLRARLRRQHGDRATASTPRSRWPRRPTSPSW